MRKAAIIVLVIIIAASVTVPVIAGRGAPATEQQGNETGKAQQAGPGGPNYGKPTLPPGEIIPVQTGPGTVYRVFLPNVARLSQSVVETVESVSPSAPKSVSPIFSIQPR